MDHTDIFNAKAKLPRALVLDIETTGLFVSEGHRIVEVGVVEMINGKPSGVEFYALVNPGRHIPEEVVRIHGIDDAKVEHETGFSVVAGQLRQFIGDDPVVITCRTKDGYTLDIAFLNNELQLAGEAPVPETQWLNIRRWSEDMFGNDQATLDKVLDRYGISRAEREANGHGAILDARLLAAAYPTLLTDYKAFRKGKALPSSNRPQPPEPNI